MGAVLDGEAVRDPGSVGREHGRLERAVVARQLRRLAAVGGDDVEAVDQLGVPALAARGGEDELCAVGRPGRRAVLAVAVRELHRLAAVEVDDEDVRAPVAGPADAVELLQQPREAARLPLALLLFVIRLVAHAGREGEARRVR